MSTFEVHKDKVRQTSVVSDKTVVIVTSWANFDGFDISLHEENGVVGVLSLTCEQVRVLQTAISAHETYDGVDKDV